MKVSSNVILGLPLSTVDGQEVMTTELVAKGYKVAENTIRSHKQRNADELQEGVHFHVAICDTTQGARNQTVWTIRGIVRLGMFIKSESAKQFRDAAEEYLVNGPEQKPLSIDSIDPETFAHMILKEVGEKKKERALKEKAEAKVKLLAPKAAFGEQLANSATLVTVEDVAKGLGISGQKLYTFLEEHKMLFKRTKTYTSSVDGSEKKKHRWIPYQDKLDKGFFKMVSHPYPDGKGQWRTNDYPKVTGKGREAIHALYTKENQEAELVAV